jgi:DNA polymerase I-like protein with 3'-5' exonuclease and polymerase domains
VECAEGNEDKVKEILRDTMENIYPELGIKLKVDTSSGKNWGEA